MQFIPTYYIDDSICSHTDKETSERCRILLEEERALLEDRVKRDIRSHLEQERNKIRVGFCKDCYFRNKHSYCTNKEVQKNCLQSESVLVTDNFGCVYFKEKRNNV